MIHVAKGKGEGQMSISKIALYSQSELRGGGYEGWGAYKKESNQ
jgi:hypothetical protein